MTEESNQVEQTEVEAASEPAEEPSDPHQIEPLDDEEDGRFLPRDDRRRLAIEERRGRRFDDDEEA